MVSDHAPDNTRILQTPLGPSQQESVFSQLHKFVEKYLHTLSVQLLEAASLGSKAAERVSRCPPSIPGRKGQDNFLGKLLECTLQV